jgi:hypothetical protein
MRARREIQVEAAVGSGRRVTQKVGVHPVDDVADPGICRGRAERHLVDSDLEGPMRRLRCSDACGGTSRNLASDCLRMLQVLGKERVSRLKE